MDLIIDEPALRTQYRRLRELRDQLREGRLHVAVLGQFKRGKSTFLNALLGETVLPVSVLPLTAVPVLLLSGDSMSARVHFLDRTAAQELAAETVASLEQQLRHFVTEADNPRNRLQVAYVEVFFPAALLQQGLVLVDTPGIGSTHLHNTSTTLEWLPRCDVGLLVVSGEPPITEAELDFLREIQPQLSEWVAIFNKKDRLNPEELTQSLDFLHQVLSANVRPTPEILAISAREGLEARQQGNDSLWASSGLERIEKDLLHRLTSHKSRLLTQSLRRKARGLAEKIQLWLRLWLKAQAEPLEELEQKITALQAHIRYLDTEQQKIADLLQADVKRLLADLPLRADALRHAAETALLPRLEQGLAAADAEGEIGRLFQSEIPPWFERQKQLQIGQIRQALEQMFAPYHQGLQQLTQDLLERIGELFGLQAVPAAEEPAFEIFQDPYWVVHEPARAGSLLRLAEAWLPARMRKARLRQRLSAELGHLALRNSANLFWSLQVSLKEHFRTLERQRQEQWAETLQLSQQTLETVLHQRQQTRENPDTVARVHRRQTQAEKVEAILLALDCAS